jgi:toxin ParE1/3/4
MVKWSFPAKDDLRQIYEYIAKDSKYYAQKVVDEIIEKSETLNKFSEMGGIVPEIGENNIRELIIYSYQPIYEISTDAVYILALIHGKQSFPTDRFPDL